VNSYPSGIVRNKIGFRFVFSEDVGWVESLIVCKKDTFSYVSGKKVQFQDV